MASENAKLYSATMEDNLVVSYKIKIFLLYEEAILLLRIYPKSENLCPHENLHTDDYSSFIDDFLKLEATKMSFIR